MAVPQGITELCVDFAPLRAAFLVRGDNLDETLEAIRINSRLWGGVHNPIAPVREGRLLDGESWTILSLHDPDVILWFSEPSEELVAGLQRAFRPLRFCRVPEGEGTDLGFAELVDAEAVVRGDADVALRAPQLCVLDSDVSSCAVNAALACELGLLRDGEVPAVSWMLGHRAVADGTGWVSEYTGILAESAGHPCLLDRTGDGLGCQAGSPSLIARTVVCGDPAEPADLCRFWNLRSIELPWKPRGELSRTLFLPEGALDSSEEVREFLLWAREDLSSAAGIMSSTPEVVFRCSDEARAKLEGQITRMADLAATCDWVTNGSSAEMVYPARPRRREDPLLVGFQGLALPQSLFTFIKPQRQHVSPLPGSARAFSVVVDTPRALQKVAGKTVGVYLWNAPQVRWPRQIDARSLFDDSPRWAKVSGSPRWVKRSLGVGRDSRPRVLSVSLPGAAQLVSQVFGDAGIEANASDKTARTQAMVHAAGGLGALAETLARSGTFGVIARMTPKRREWLAKAVADRAGLAGQREAVGAILEVLVGEDVPILLGPMDRRLAQLAPDGLAPRDVLPVLDHLARLGIVTRGVRLTCARCGCGQFYPLGYLDDTVRCPLCRGDFPMPASEEGGEVQWRYRLSPIYYPLVDQGTYAVVAALGWRENGCQGLFEWQSELLLSGKPEGVGEVDLAYIADGLFGLGECKTGVPISADAVDRYVALARRVGAHELLFATTAEYGADTHEALDRARGVVRRVHILDSTQLPM